MLANKDLISRVIIAIVFLFLTVYVLGPVFLNFIKSKLPGHQQPENDIDSMIRRQKERLRAQYGIVGKSEHEALPEVQTAQTKTVETLYKETRWGGGDFLKAIQSKITKNYSYTITESKINAFIMLAEKKKWANALSADNQSSPEALNNFLSVVLLLKIFIDEIRAREYFLLSKVAMKCNSTPSAFALALQIKLLNTIASQKNLSEEKIYSELPLLHQFSEETLNSALELLLKKEGNLWAKGHNLFFEELALHLNYAHLLQPVNRIAHKKDSEGARKILGVTEEMSLEEIKKTYKKIALSKHPDKILAQKLPRPVEKRAIKNFTLIQEAYDLLLASKKVE